MLPITVIFTVEPVFFTPRISREVLGVISKSSSALDMGRRPEKVAFIKFEIKYNIFFFRGTLRYNRKKSELKYNFFFQGNSEV